MQNSTNPAKRAAAKPSAGTVTKPRAGTATTPQQAAAPAAGAFAALLATVVATPTVAAPAATSVALRGGIAIANVRLSGAPYRTGAPHNAQWWATLQAKLAAGPAPVAALLLAPANPAGVPAHFVGYALRRGYLAAA